MASPTASLEHIWNEACHQVVHRAIQSRAGPTKADDLTIVVFEKLQRDRGKSREQLLEAHAKGDRDHVDAILRKVARRVVIDADRHDEVEERYALQYHYAQPEPALPEALLERTEQIEELNKMLASVPGGAELSMHLAGYTYAEIQHHVGAATPDAIRKRIARALATLRKDEDAQL